MDGIFYSIIAFLLDKFGLETTIRIKDMVMLISAFFAGMISMVLLFSQAVTKVRVKEGLGSAVAVCMTHPDTKKRLIFVGNNNWTRSLRDSVSVHTSILLMHYIRIPTITVKDVKLIKIVCGAFIVCTLWSFSFALYLATHMIVETHKDQLIHIHRGIYDHDHSVHHINE